MPVDSSIYFQQQPIDILGNVQKGMALGQNIQDRKVSAQDLKWKNEAQAVYGLGIKQNPDGSTTFDQNAAMAGMQKADPNNPYIGKMAYDLGQTMRTQGIQDQELEMKKQADARAKESHLADLAAKNAQTDKLRYETSQLKLSPTAKLSEGQKTYDKEYAKDHNDWSSGGNKIAREEINKLKGVADALGPVKKLPDGRLVGGLTTGGLTGAFWDQLTSNDVLKARADVQSSIMNSLRATLGSAFTEKEGERVIKNTWNESDSTENNLARINRLIQNLESQANDKDQKSQYFEKTKGTLSGYKMNELGMSPKATIQDSGAVKWARENPNDPRSAEILKLNGIGG